MLATIVLGTGCPDKNGGNDGVCGDGVCGVGENGTGQLGDSTNDYSYRPVAVLGLQAILAVSSGGAHSCALDEDDRVWCWGNYQKGQLVDGLIHEECTISPDCSPNPVAVATH